MTTIHASADHCEKREPVFQRKRDADWNPRGLWIVRDHGDHFVSTAKNFDIPYSKVLARAAEKFESIAIDADVLGGTPRISGTRVPVYMILDAIEHYGNLDGAMISYPQLSRDQISQAVCFATEVLEHPVEHES
jgi:uncharacterized protein (DUF433 family)